MVRVILVVCTLALSIPALQVAKRTFQVAKEFVGIATLDAIMVSDLQKDCGYGRDGTPGVHPYPEDCVATVRRLIRKSATRENFEAFQFANAYGRICAAELLELPDAELVDIVAGWAARDAREIEYLLPAEVVVNTNLVRNFRC